MISLNELHFYALKEADISKLQFEFKISRRLYKHIEPAVEYYFQGLTKRINGPALPDVKVEDGVVWDPHGFQVIEEIIFSDYAIESKDDLLNEIKVLQTDLRYVRKGLAEQTISREHAAQMIQHQFIRISTLGITGFDSPVSFASIEELPHALEGIRKTYAYFNPKDNKAIELFDQTNKFIADNTDFNSFDRLTFITDYLMPLSVAYQFPDVTIDLKMNRAFQGTFADYIQGKGLNPDYYVPYEVGKTNDKKVALGERLFYETKLSRTGQISCATCHDPKLYFTDGKVKASNLIHGGNLLRNTPTLFYSSLQASQFYDMRSPTLEDQIHDVMKNEVEFNLPANEIAAIFAKDKDYTSLFLEAFPKLDSVTGFAIRNAIAAYVRSLNPFNSRIDKYIQGNKSSLNAEEILGFNLFAGKAKCATCHFMPVYNGTVPPWMQKAESEVIGVPGAVMWKEAMIDQDSGRYLINRIEELQFAFKTPTVRNVEKTGPYMHNGVYDNLADVIEFYHKGGGEGIGIEMNLQTLPFDSLVLDASEKKAIEAFLKSLTDEIKE